MLSSGSLGDGVLLSFRRGSRHRVNFVAVPSMRPYPAVPPLLTWYPIYLLCLLVGVVVTPATAWQEQSQAGTSAAIASYPAKADPLTRSGFSHYHELDYDRAIRDFEQVLEKYPDDPFAVNHLLEALLFRELYHAGVLDSSVYSSDAFLSKRRVAVPAKVQKRIQELGARSMELSDTRIRANPKDAEALYARGVTRALRSSYIALVERSWFAALKRVKEARKDHERVLELDPNYADAKLMVGMHDYIVGSMPWAARILAHIVGESGNKERGLKYMNEAGEGGGEAAVDAKLLLGLFLRREQRYQEALALGDTLRQAHPRNFLFAMEEAHVLKEWGKGPPSITAYRRVLTAAKEGKYFDPHLEFAYWGLGEALRGQRDYHGAADAYSAIQALRQPDADLLLRANLAAGQMFDVLSEREQAIKKYEAVVALNADSEQASRARRLLKQPYRQN
jgi:tetratricopeptide (TPR) repeat protein